MIAGRLRLDRQLGVGSAIRCWEMAQNPLFSTYRQGENRVTSSMLAVFERIDLSLLGRLLAAASGESSLEMVTFTNQPAGRGGSVPDARIAGRFSYWFEVKTARNAVDRHQLAEHLVSLGAAAQERLFVVSPDPGQPSAVDALGDPRLTWFNFSALDAAMERELADTTGGITEQARFLLRELRALLVEEGLIDNDDVVVVAARRAYPEYLERSAYICQARRGFRGGLTNIAFYTDKAIQKPVPAILHREDDVMWTSEEAEQRRAGSDADRAIAELIDTDVRRGDASIHPIGEPHQVFLLTGPDDPLTVRLPQPIENASVSESGHPTAWTMGQRYTSLAALTHPDVRTTADLDHLRPA